MNCCASHSKSCDEPQQEQKQTHDCDHCTFCTSSHLVFVVNQKTVHIEIDDKKEVSKTLHFYGDPTSFSNKQFHPPEFV